MPDKSFPRSAPLRRTGWIRRRRPAGTPQAVRDAVTRRDGGCVAPEAFGLRCAGRTEQHHIETKGMGGKRAVDTTDDLITLCAAHHGYVTTHPADAIEAGLARRRNR